LKKIVQLYNPKNNPPLESTINSRLGKAGLGFIEFTGDIIKFGKSSVRTLTKGKNPSSKDLDILEKNVLRSMYFNINKDFLNKEEKFNFVGVNPDTFEINVYDGLYNDFVKSNTKTYMRSTKLDDGSYSSTIQNIVRFDMKTKEIEAKPLEEKELTLSSEDLTTHPDLMRLAEELGDDINIWITPILEGSITLEDQLEIMKISVEANNHSNNYKC